MLMQVGKANKSQRAQIDINDVKSVEKNDSNDFKDWMSEWYGQAVVCFERPKWFRKRRKNKQFNICINRNSKNQTLFVNDLQIHQRISKIYNIIIPNKIESEREIIVNTFGVAAESVSTIW